jgi:hypothetical protein
LTQPFLLKTVLEARVRRHIPDYLLLTEQVPVVVGIHLEADLGQPLFARAERGRAMKLTAFGEEVVAAARNIGGRGKDAALQSETGEGL